MNNGNSDQHATLKKWAQLLIQNTETSLSKTLITALLLSNSEVEKLSSWFLWVCGAIFALVLSNLNEVRSVLSADVLSRVLTLTFFSVLFGIIAKYLTTWIQIEINMFEVIEEKFPVHLEPFFEQKGKILEHAERDGLQVSTDVDLQRVVEPILDCFPRYLSFFKRQARKNAQRGYEDPLFGYKKTLKRFFLRSLFTGFQALFFLIMALMLILQISIS